MRISGLASGLDTENIIKDLMRAERIPVDRVYQQKIRAEWKRDAYRDLNSKLLRLRNLAFDLSLQGTYRVKTASSTHQDLVSVAASSNSQEGTFYLQVWELAAPALFQTNVSGDTAQNFAAFLSELEGETVLELRGTAGQMETITVSPGDTLEALLQRINQNKNLGLNAYYDSYSGQVAISSKTWGENAVLEVGADPGQFFAKVFGVDLAQDPILARGRNARLEINGLSTERASNTFELNGTTVTLNAPTEQSIVRLEVRLDPEAVAEKIGEFVDLYNEIVGELNLALREEVYRDYPPLSPAQREEMSEKEIELWEERAKSGLLRSDSLVSGLLGEMRLVLGGRGPGGSGALAHLSELGIKTGAWFEYGHLHLDENQLQKALEENPDGVMAFFTALGESEEERGIARRFTAVLDESMAKIVSAAGKASLPYDQSYLGRQIRDYETRIEFLEERLGRVEQTYWDKFITMERVLDQLYSQSDWLYQQLMALQGW